MLWLKHYRNPRLTNSNENNKGTNALLLTYVHFVLDKHIHVLINIINKFVTKITPIICLTTEQTSIHVLKVVSLESQVIIFVISLEIWEWKCRVMPELIIPVETILIYVSMSNYHNNSCLFK